MITPGSHLLTLLIGLPVAGAVETISTNRLTDIPFLWTAPS